MGPGLGNSHGASLEAGALSSTGRGAAASGWQVISCDGHDNEAVAAAILEARTDTSRPTLIDCRTIIGFGAPNKQGTAATHGAPLGESEIEQARKKLNWPHAAFDIPQAIYDAWHSIAERGKNSRKVWEERAAIHKDLHDFNASIDGTTREKLVDALTQFRTELVKTAPKVATRKASQMALEVINKTVVNTIGGSADLTGSNLTKTEGMGIVAKDNFDGRYIHYGVREHAMAAVMNGLVLHGGFIPYGGTFLAFADYCRGAIRLSAIMGIPVVYVMTHDSIGLGEDGPTHQPVEQVASLRAIPNLNVFRPADAVETAEAWELAIMADATPSILCLSRQGLPTVRTKATKENMTARGAYVLRDTSEVRDITIIATGSEIEIALLAADQLSEKGIHAAVVSIPCFELFEKQDVAYRASVLGSVPRLGIEALIKQGWGELLGDNSTFVGMTGFGASAPAGELFKKFGITVEAAVQAAQILLKKQ
ncbi:MAG: transketolase [Blastopirellula sp.]|nr:MAG: transketolase [Blastopirellula sp.]